MRGIPLYGDHMPMIFRGGEGNGRGGGDDDDDDTISGAEGRGSLGPGAGDDTLEGGTGGQSPGEEVLGRQARRGRSRGEVAFGSEVAEAAAAGLGESPGETGGAGGPGAGGRGGGNNRLIAANERRRAAPPVQAETPEEQEERVRRAVVILGVPGSLSRRANTLF